MPNILLSGSDRESMWQEEATLQTAVGLWNVLYPNLFESCIENAFGSATASQIKPDCNPLIACNTLGKFSWHKAAGLIQSPPSLASEGSCTASPSECPGSPYKSCPSKNLVQEKSRKMNNPVPSASCAHVVDDDPDATSPPVSVNNWWPPMLLPTSTQSHTSPTSAAIPDLYALNWSSDLSAPNVEQLSHSKAIATAYSTITADCHQHMDAGSTSTLLDSSLSTGSNMGGVTDSSVWSQVLLGSASSEAVPGLHNCSVEGLQDLWYPRAMRQNEFLLPDQLRRIEDIPPWDPTLKNFTFQGDEMNLSTLEKTTPTIQYPHLADDRLSSTTCTLSDMETWSAPPDHNNAVCQSGPLTGFSSGLHLGGSHFEAIRVKQEHPLSYSCPIQSATSPSSQFESIRVKQEHPLSYSCSIPSATSPFWLQGCGVDYKGDMASSQLLECENKPLFKSLVTPSNLPASSLGEEFPGRWSAHSSMFPATAFQQTLTSGPAGAMSKQPVQMLVYGNTVNRHPLDLSNLRPDVKHQLHVPAIDRSSSLHYGHQTFESKPFDSKPLHEPPSNWRTLGHVEELRDSGADTKRNVGSINSGDGSSEACFKRPRAEQAPATLPFKQQARKEKLGDRITALQQLVSPFGKTDTASVLLEAIGYIKFLQEQVQVLSTPYMKSTSTTANQNDPGKKSWSSSDKNQDSADEPKQDLRSRGLCLVPVSCTLHVANDNGADYWAPSLGGGYR